MQLLRLGTFFVLILSQATAFSTSTSSSSRTFVNLDERFPRDMTSLEGWAAVCGIQKAPGIELVPTTLSDNNQQFGVMTTDNIPAHTPILFVPTTGPILSSSQVQQEVGDGRSSVEGQQGNARTLLTRLGETDHFPRFCLFLKLLMEYEKGSDSPWFPWLNSLPRFYTNGASTTPFCFTCLPPLAAKLTKEERTRCLHFQQTLQQMYGHLVTDETQTKDDLIRWAYNVVYTRCLVRKGEPVLVPMADMFNHGTTQNEAVIHYDEDGNCCVCTTMDVPAGSALRISYTNGDNTNPSFLFARYGFIDQETPATFCKIMIDKPSQEIFAMGYHPSNALL